MNQFIKTYLQNSEKYMKAAIMNALYDIDSQNETCIDLGYNISFNLLSDCLTDLGWEFDTANINKWPSDFISYWTSPNKINVIIELPLFNKEKECRIYKV